MAARPAATQASRRRANQRCSRTSRLSESALDQAAQTARLHKAGMQLDLGGIGKGYACDEAIKVLKNARHMAAP